MLKTFLCLLVLAGPVVAESSASHLLEMKMHAKIKALDDSLEGALGAATIDLTSGRVFVYNGETIFPAASSIKIAVLIQMFRSAEAQEFRLDDQVTLTANDSVAGSGILHQALKKGPVTLTVRELITAMIQHSDNSATNKCISMAKMDRINRMLEKDGYRVTRLNRIMMDMAAANRGVENVATPVEMARLIESIYRGKAAGAESCREMISILKLVASYLRDSIPTQVEVASKPGEVEGARTETGIVYLAKRPFAISVMSSYLENQQNPVGAVARIVFDYFQKLALANSYGHKLE